VIEEDRFIELLSRRLSLSIPTSEDAVRYTFFAALAEAGMEPEKLILEYQHPDIEAAKVDAVILGDAGQPKVAIEFKYDRRNRGGTPQPLLKRPARRLPILPALRGCRKIWSDCSFT